MTKKYLIEVRKAINQPEPEVFNVTLHATNHEHALFQVKQRYPNDVILTITEQD